MFKAQTITVVTESPSMFFHQSWMGGGFEDPSPALSIGLKFQQDEAGETDNPVRLTDAIETPIRQIGTILGQDVARFASASWRRFP